MAALRNSTQMFPIVEAWLQSGQTQEEFSKAYDMSKHVLSYWVCRYRKADSLQEEKKSRADPPSFVQVKTTAGSGVSMEIALPTGVVVRFSSTVPVAYLGELLKICSP
jgi:hypothetical protein